MEELTKQETQHLYHPEQHFIPLPSRHNKTKSISKPEKAKRKEPMIWSSALEIYYFCGAINFSLKYPYYNISWQQWKVDRFYDAIAEDLTCRLEKKRIVTPKQCKTKDQQLKQRYFKASNPLDIFELAEMMVNKEAKQLREAKLEGTLKEEDESRLEYYNQTLSDLADFNLKNSGVNEYEIQLTNLSTYGKKMMDEIMQVARMLQ